MILHTVWQRLNIIHKTENQTLHSQIVGLVQERRNSIADALELHLPSLTHQNLPHISHKGDLWCVCCMLEQTDLIFSFQPTAYMISILISNILICVIQVVLSLTLFYKRYTIYSWYIHDCSQKMSWNTAMFFAILTVRDTLALHQFPERLPRLHPENPLSFTDHSNLPRWHSNIGSKVPHPKSVALNIHLHIILTIAKKHV